MQRAESAVFCPCAGRPCPVEAGWCEVVCWMVSKGWMLLEGWVEEWWSRSGRVAGHTGVEDRGRVPG